MIILEGIDGVGKTTISKLFEENGYNIHHLKYDEKNEDGFISLLNQDDGKLVLDRGFVTELVYGPILRDFSRINKEQEKNLINLYSNARTIIIYLKAAKKDLLERRKDSEEDYNLIMDYYERLNDSYNSIMKYISEYITTYTIDTSEVNLDNTKKFVKQLIRSEYSEK